MLESKSSALPAWLHPNIMVHLGGIEPPAHGLEVRCSIHLSYRCTSLEFQKTITLYVICSYAICLWINYLLERVKGIEPSQLAWEASALPLSYTRSILIHPAKLFTKLILKTVPLSDSHQIEKMIWVLCLYH